ncbi:hypothetical protein ES704_03584 [subsurface metagenome]|jgi:hypothetical protein
MKGKVTLSVKVSPDQSEDDVIGEAKTYSSKIDFESSVELFQKLDQRFSEFRKRVKSDYTDGQTTLDEYQEESS